MKIAARCVLCAVCVRARVFACACLCARVCVRVQARVRVCVRVLQLCARARVCGAHPVVPQRDRGGDSEGDRLAGLG